MENHRFDGKSRPLRQSYVVLIECGAEYVNVATRLQSGDERGNLISS